MDKVSVILPIYNCDKYVKHTIASLLSQDYKNWELLVVDDASTDNSLAEVQRFAAEDERIKVFHQPQNVGVSECRNFALTKATGRYVAFIDADDLWSKQKLSKQIIFMRKHHAGLSHTAVSFINERGELLPRGHTPVDECVDMKHYMKTSQILMSTVMIDRERIPDIEFPHDRKLCEDARLWMKYLRRGEKFYGLNEVLMLYRVRPNQLSRRKDKMALAAFKRYMTEETLSYAERISCYLHYACNAPKKWRRKNNLDAEYIKNNFNCRS